MTRNQFITALGFGVVAVLSIIQPTAAKADCNPEFEGCSCARGPLGFRCFWEEGSKGECEDRGANYRWEEGHCIKNVSKRGAQEICESKGENYHFDAKTGSCLKTIGRQGACPPGHRFEGDSKGVASCVSVPHEKALCDAKGYGYDAKTGSCIKTISKKPVTSGGVGGE